MAYVAVKGGRLAIDESLLMQKWERLKRGKVLDLDQALGGLRSLIDQVMSEGSLYSEDIAALAVKQAEGSPEEAAFLLRAFRSTLPRKHYTLTASTLDMRVHRRISASFKDIPGGQILGSSVDYSHRLLDFDLDEEKEEGAAQWLKWYETREIPKKKFEKLPKVVEYLRAQGLMKNHQPLEEAPKDITKESIKFPATRSQRLQVLTRGQTGAVTALGYASLRGWGISNHPTVGELRVGDLPLTIPNPYGDQEDEEDGYFIGSVKITEVESFMPVHQKVEGKDELSFEIGYGVCFGQNETKAIAMSILDHNLEQKDADRSPSHDEEFVLYHIDSVEATGFISHLKLPHYVTFQSKLESVRKTREEKDGK